MAGLGLVLLIVGVVIFFAALIWGYNSNQASKKASERNEAIVIVAIIGIVLVFVGTFVWFTEGKPPKTKITQEEKKD